MVIAVPCARAALDIEGEWKVTTTYPGSSSVARIEIRREGDNYTGQSGWLFPDYAPSTYSGKAERHAASLTRHLRWPGTDR
jgi:hypothetical protein